MSDSTIVEFMLKIIQLVNLQPLFLALVAFLGLAGCHAEDDEVISSADFEPTTQDPLSVEVPPLVKREQPKKRVTASGIFHNQHGMTFVGLPELEIAFGIHEITRDLFEKFAVSTGLEDQSWRAPITGAYLQQGGNHPVVNVSWEEAHHFCDWLSQTEGVNYRLPSDYEWSIASGLEAETGYLSPNARADEAPKIYHWGTQWEAAGPDENLADKSFRAATSADGCFSFDDGFAATAPVGSFRPNALGIYDLAGNVTEWVYDWYRSRDEFKTLRGASYGSGVLQREVHQKGYRTMRKPSFRSEFIGFRIVAEISDNKWPEVTMTNGATSVEPPVESEMIAPPPIPVSIDVEKETVSRTNIKVVYKGKDGINLRQDRSFSSGNVLGSLHQQSAVSLTQVGDEIKEGSETWVNVEVKGWISVKNRSYTYLKEAEDGKWKVIWNKRNDRFVALRSGTDYDDPLVGKIHYNSMIDQLDFKKIGSRHYLYGKISGWAVKRNQVKTYLSPVD